VGESISLGDGNISELGSLSRGIYRKRAETSNNVIIGYFGKFRNRRADDRFQRVREIC
jgi:hypothetical protein